MPGAALNQATLSPIADVLAVLVTYRQSPRTCATLRSLEAQVESIGPPLALLVYDNSPGAAPEEDMPDQRIWSVTYRHDRDNPGVSAAYRAGAELASALGKRWLLLLDQDTCFAPDALSRYLEAMVKHPEGAMLCPMLQVGPVLISPCAYRYMRGTSLPAIPPGPRDFRGISVLNSGMCIALEVYRQCGGHDPAIGLDFSDHEFVGRLRRVIPGFVVVDTVAEHGFSGMGTPQSIESAAARLRAYVHGALRSSRSAAELLSAVALVTKRTLFLSWRYRSPIFLRTAIRTVLNDY